MDNYNRKNSLTETENSFDFGLTWDEFQDISAISPPSIVPADIRICGATGQSYTCRVLTDQIDDENA